MLIDLLDADRQIGAVCVAEMTGGTFLRENHNGAVAIRVYRQDLCRAEFNANIAALAPSGIKRDFATRSFSCGCCGGRYGRRYFGHNHPFAIGMHGGLSRNCGRIHHNYVEIGPRLILTKILHSGVVCKAIYRGWLTSIRAPFRKDRDFWSTVMVSRPVSLMSERPSALRASNLGGHGCRLRIWINIARAGASRLSLSTRLLMALRGRARRSTATRTPCGHNGIISVCRSQTVRCRRVILTP